MFDLLENIFHARALLQCLYALCVYVYIYIHRTERSGFFRASLAPSTPPPPLRTMIRPLRCETLPTQRNVLRIEAKIAWTRRVKAIFTYVSMLMSNITLPNKRRWERRCSTCPYANSTLHEIRTIRTFAQNTHTALS